jgi:urease accessory protein
MRHGITLLILLLPLPALGHHPLGGAVPQTWWEGLASGIGHPMLGIDHLAFLLAAGVLASLLRGGAVPGAALAIAGAAFLGTLLHIAGVALPAAPTVVAVSTLVAGAVLLVRVPPGAPAALLPLAGLFHGYVFAEAVIGSEPAPIIAYLVGLSVTQAAIVLAAAIAARWLAGRGLDRPTRRSVGAVAACVGVLFLAAGGV